VGSGRTRIRVRIRAPICQHDRLVGELFGLGTLGIEERDRELWAYFDPPAPLEELRALLGVPPIEIGDAEQVPDQDWNARSREGLAPRRVGPLWIRPSWCAPAGSPELVLDPAQGFGSGEHASTRLALELALGALRRGDRMLDVGTGSGILARTPGATVCARGSSAAACSRCDPMPASSWWSRTSCCTSSSLSSPRCCPTRAARS
jgi:ribosomal protein L11 methyltransferase